MTEEVLRACAAGQISPQIAVARLVLSGSAVDAQALAARAGLEPAGSPLRVAAALAADHAPRLARLGRIAADGLDPEGPDLLAATAALFDRLAAVEPEAAVAFYSLGDPALLAAATAELVAVVRAWVPIDGRAVLDFGSGIGRLATALAPDAGRVVGVDISAGMVEQARERAAGSVNVAFEATDGGVLPFADGSFDLAIAVDSFPYLVRAGVLAVQMAEMARVLRPGGDLLVFNWSYRGDDAADAREAEGAPGFELVRSRERPFAIWDGVGYHLRRLP
ncbi:class I SAM-dependent methyltransferase [uncultured Sphingomonas sp.]|uniref:class I SAM-dependent methyltransferase n=1 Tax=uncultured Sphingomonas sp. TaxID=158754 RepID=UPI0035CB1108